MGNRNLPYSTGKFLTVSYSGVTPSRETVSVLVPYLTLTIPDTTGATAPTPFFSPKAMASSMVREVFTPLPWMLTEIILVPRSFTWLVTLWVTPWPRDTRAITAATPITIPSIVSMDLILLVRMAFQAILKACIVLIPASPRCLRRSGRPECG
ncbi:hypothetical protein D3C75_989560 [compost metagenome]